MAGKKLPYWLFKFQVFEDKFFNYVALSISDLVLSHLYALFRELFPIPVDTEDKSWMKCREQPFIVLCQWSFSLTESLYIILKYNAQSFLLDKI